MVSEQFNSFGGDGKTNIVKGQLVERSTNIVFNFEVRIMDGFAMVWAGSSKFLNDIVKDGLRQGKNIKRVPNQKLVIEEYPGRLRDDITKEIVANLQKGGANITKHD